MYSWMYAAPAADLYRWCCRCPCCAASTGDPQAAGPRRRRPLARRRRRMRPLRRPPPAAPGGGPGAPSVLGARALGGAGDGRLVVRACAKSRERALLQHLFSTCSRPDGQHAASSPLPAAASFFVAVVAFRRRRRAAEGPVTRGACSRSQLLAARVMLRAEAKGSAC